VNPRRLVAALALAVAIPAAAYVLPVPGILRRMGERRHALGVDALEVQGTVTARGELGARLAAAAGAPAGAEVTVPARFLMKVPGRCRLELVPAAATPGAERPAVSTRGDGRLSGKLADVAPAVALVRSVCALLAIPTAGDASDLYASALSRRGVAIGGEATLGRFDGRIAYVVGGHARDARPLLYVAKDGFQPLRLVSTEGKDLADVRLLGWGSPVGGEWFPRAVEVWAKDRDAATLRFNTERAISNPTPRIPDSLF
jgi:hypothetical protein